jgi:excisionase family DNA binding protein
MKSTERTRPSSRRDELLLTKQEAAASLNVTGRFIERLIAERRVRYVKVGRHVRIPESAIAELIDGGTVDVIGPRRWR